jgi:hypothetical protein
MQLRKYYVEVYESNCDDFEDRGAVLLPFHAEYSHIEHALAAVGVYAPRGMDHVEWSSGWNGALITDAGGTVIVRMSERV